MITRTGFLREEAPLVSTSSQGKCSWGRSKGIVASRSRLNFPLEVIQLRWLRPKRIWDGCWGKFDVRIEITNDVIERGLLIAIYTVANEGRRSLSFGRPTSVDHNILRSPDVLWLQCEIECDTECVPHATLVDHNNTRPSFL